MPLRSEWAPLIYLSLATGRAQNCFRSFSEPALTSSETLVARVGDADLATAVGVPLPRDEDRTALLSPREREVYDLVVQGLRNREIGKLLFYRRVNRESAYASHLRQTRNSFAQNPDRSSDA